MDSIITGGFTNKIRLSLIKREYCVKKIHGLRAFILYYMKSIHFHGVSHKTLTFYEILLDFEHQQASSHVVATLSELIAQATLQLLIKIDET